MDTTMAKKSATTTPATRAKAGAKARAKAPAVAVAAPAQAVRKRAASVTAPTATTAPATPRRKAVGRANGAGVTDPTEQIRVRAYYLSIARSEGDGGAMDDWLQAERDLAEGKIGR